MCMDGGPFLLIHGEEQISLENIASILPTAGGLNLVDVFGTTRSVEGVIEEIDLLNSRIVLKAAS